MGKEKEIAFFPWLFFLLSKVPTASGTKLVLNPHLVNKQLQRDTAPIHLPCRVFFVGFEIPFLSPPILLVIEIKKISNFS